MQGRVYFNLRQSSMDCIIRDFTTIGARLQFAEIPALPDVFEVFIPTRDDYFQAHTVWHKGREIGVAWCPEGILIPHRASDRSGDPIEDRVTRLEHEVAVLRKQLNACKGKE
jgi:hypothetical protein